MDATLVALCFFCDKPVDEEYYCYGCGEYVCELCNLNLATPRAHQVEDHDQVDIVVGLDGEISIDEEV